MIDIEERQLRDASLDQAVEQLRLDLGAGLDVDFTRLGIDDVLRDILTDEILVRELDRLDALLGDETGHARGDLAAGFDDHVPGIGIDDVVGRRRPLQALRVERLAPGSPSRVIVIL